MKTYRQYKQLSESEYLARFANLTDEQLKAKKIQANRLFRAPYNRRLNYMKLMDHKGDSRHIIHEQHGQSIFK